LFGKIEFVAKPTKTNPEGIIITNGFESKNIVRVNLPALSKATNGKFTAMRWHNECEYQLVKLSERLEKENLHTKILSYAGAFYPRFIRGSRTQLSNHSWGTAFDINVVDKHDLSLYENYLRIQLHNPQKNTLLFLGHKYHKMLPEQDVIEQIPHWIFPIAGLFSVHLPRLLVLLLNHKEDFDDPIPCVLCPM
jgi:hypothetical protein